LRIVRISRGDGNGEGLTLAAPAGITGRQLRVSKI
jgi:hypothetical protein